MTDIMEDWKRQRFVVSNYNDETIVVLSDLSYWSAHYDELLLWSEQVGLEVVGMTVDIPDSERLTLFALRWS